MVRFHNQLYRYDLAKGLFGWGNECRYDVWIRWDVSCRLYRYQRAMISMCLKIICAFLQRQHFIHMMTRDRVIQCILFSFHIGCELIFQLGVSVLDSWQWPLLDWLGAKSGSVVWQDE